MWPFAPTRPLRKPEIYEALEKRGVEYAIRMPANENLEWAIAELLFRPPGRPSHKPLVRYRSFQYQAGSCTKPRRSWEPLAAARAPAADRHLVFEQRASSASSKPAGVW